MDAWALRESNCSSHDLLPGIGTPFLRDRRLGCKTWVNGYPGVLEDPPDSPLALCDHIVVPSSHHSGLCLGPRSQDVESVSIHALLFLDVLSNFSTGIGNQFCHLQPLYQPPIPCLLFRNRHFINHGHHPTFNVGHRRSQLKSNYTPDKPERKTVAVYITR